MYIWGDIFKCIVVKGNFCRLIAILSKSVYYGPIDNFNIGIGNEWLGAEQVTRHFLN